MDLPPPVDPPTPMIIITIIACVAGVYFIFVMASIHCILRLIEEEDSCNKGMHVCI